MSSAAQRLMLPALFRQCKPATRTSIRRQVVKQPWQPASLHTSSGWHQEAFEFQRYGSATEPQIPPPQASEQKSKPDQALPGAEEGQRPDASEAPMAGQSASSQRDNQSSENDTEAAEELRQFKESKSSGTPLDIVLKTPAPQVLHEDGHKPPHLAPPLYVHHFDTYSLVRELAKAGFVEEQSTTIMKAVRQMLADNLEVAREGLVSKSDMENETYLFRAACSELRMSLHSSRHSETQKQRTQRAQLQHEHDILNQKVTQDMLSLREELKGLFNDRKLAAQEEKRNLDAKIQQINYDITVALNSDSKSQVEGLRWVLTRRAATAIVAAAFMIISSLNYSSHLNRERDEAEKKRKATLEAAEKAQSEARANPSRDSGTQTEGNYEESLG